MVLSFTQIKFNLVQAKNLNPFLLVVGGLIIWFTRDVVCYS